MRNPSLFNDKLFCPRKKAFWKSIRFTLGFFSAAFFLLISFSSSLAEDKKKTTAPEKFEFGKKNPRAEEIAKSIEAGTYSSLSPGPALSGPPNFLFDDLSRQSMKTAVQNQLKLIRQTNLFERVPLANERVTRGRLARGLEAFLRLLDQNPPVAEFSRKLKEDFTFIRVGRGPRKDFLFTGYYTPVIHASRKRRGKFIYPLYKVPPPRKGPTKVGLSIANKPKPHFTREQIDRLGALKNKNLEIAWLRDDLDRFFLHIQGSGMLKFKDGTVLAVRFAGSNNHPYTGIGKLMIKDQVIEPSAGSMQGIKKYLYNNPHAIPKYFYQNKRYIFFSLAKGLPLGSGGSPVVAGRSIATDKSHYPIGGLAFISLKMPVLNEKHEIVRWKPVSRFVVDQDTGSGIKGPGRADLYFGAGYRPGVQAGQFKQRGEVYYLLKKE